jgi:hypothetical protein
MPSMPTWRLAGTSLGLLLSAVFEMEAHGQRRRTSAICRHNEYTNLVWFAGNTQKAGKRTPFHSTSAAGLPDLAARLPKTQKMRNQSLRSISIKLASAKGADARGPWSPIRCRAPQAFVCRSARSARIMASTPHRESGRTSATGYVVSAPACVLPEFWYSGHDSPRQTSPRPPLVGQIDGNPRSWITLPPASVRRRCGRNLPE